MGRIDSSSKHGPTSRCLARRGPWSMAVMLSYIEEQLLHRALMQLKGRDFNKTKFLVHILPEVASHCTVCLQISWRFFPNGRHPGSSMGRSRRCFALRTFCFLPLQVLIVCGTSQLARWKVSNSSVDWRFTCFQTGSWPPNFKMASRIAISIHRHP